MSQAGPFLEAAGVSWLKWHLPGPFHILVLLPFASCQSSPLSSVMLHGVLCLSWNALGHLLALPCPTRGQAASTCAWLACSQVLSGYPNISHSQSLPSSASFLSPFGFVGRGMVSGLCQQLGVAGRGWIMCLFFNSIKKPTSKIPFSFFLDLGIQPPALN